MVLLPVGHGEPVDQRTLSRSGTARYTNDQRLACVWKQLLQYGQAVGGAILHPRDDTRECPCVALEKILEELVRHVDRSDKTRGYDLNISRAITSRWISLVPSPIVQSLTSR